MIKFIRTKTVLTFHEDQINQYGGNRGVRDKRLLRSSLERTEASVDGNLDIFMIAATYGFNICHNSPFFDGAKRTVLITMYTFLYVNGAKLTADKEDLYAIILDLSKGKITTRELADFLKKNCKPRT